MRTRFFALILALSLFGLVPASYAQTALSETTVSQAMTASQTSIVLASATGVTAGGGIYVDNEYMTVAATYSSGTRVPVIRRGAATAHAAGVLVYVGPAPAFVRGPRSGACTTTQDPYSPVIDVTSGAIYECSSTVEKWVDLRKLVPVVCQTGPLATGSVDQSCFTANRQYLVYKINYVAKTAEAGGTVTLIPRRQQGTEAPASGDALATAINCVAATTAAETVVTATLTATESLLILSAGDRLGLDFTDDTPGELAGVVVTFYLYPL